MPLNKKTLVAFSNYHGIYETCLKCLHLTAVWCNGQSPYWLKDEVHINTSHQYY